MKIFRILSVFVLSALMLGSALVAAGQDAEQYNDQPSQADPPTRAARLQYMSGSVSVQPHGTDDWAAGTINRPLTNSDNVWADKNSRAEINVGTGLIRIDSESSLTLTNVSENMVQLQLHQGAMNLHVRRLYDGETFEVDTPNQAFTVLKPGDYRFDVDPNADKTVVTVWRGEGESSGQGPAVRIREDQQARFSNGNSLNNDIHAAPSPDGFDEWAQSRDGRVDHFDHSASARYVSPDVVGSEDLDEYGTWRDVPQYGHIWTPSYVEAGWSPYRNGHWIWVDPWGWTWVEDEPWGYAPFHYGRWVYYNNYWGWAPGPIYVRPYYSPALVAWFGGPGWGSSFGFGFGGGYGWCPLGFGEPFIPWYGVSRGYFNRVNITNTRITNINITNIYNNNFVNNRTWNRGDPGKARFGGPNSPQNGQQLRYVNMHAPNGFTAVSRNALVNSQPVSRNVVKMSPNELNRATPMHNVDARPTRTTMLGANAGRSAAMPPQRTFARPVVSRVAAPANGQGSFHSLSPAMSGRNMPGQNRPGENTARPNGPMGNSNAQSTSRPSENVSRGGIQTMKPQPGTASHAVPRPPSAGGFEGRGNVNSSVRTGPANNSGMNSRTEAQRPMMAPSANSRPESRSAAPQMSPRGESVPRPATGGMSRSIEQPSYGGRGNSGGRVSAPSSQGSGGGRSGAGRSGGERSGPPRSEMNVPRPSSPAAAPRGYSSASGRGNYPSTSSGRYEAPRPAPSYQAPTYQRSGPSSPSYGGGGYNRPAPSMSNDRGGFSGRPSPAPSYGGGSYGRSAPAPAYGGGSYSRPSVPAYSGGGYSRGGGSSSGYSGGGGGRASAPSHATSSGGGGRSQSSGNGSHGGRN